MRVASPARVNCFGHSILPTPPACRCLKDRAIADHNRNRATSLRSVQFKFRKKHWLLEHGRIAEHAPKRSVIPNSHNTPCGFLSRDPSQSLRCGGNLLCVYAVGSSNFAPPHGIPEQGLILTTSIFSWINPGAPAVGRLLSLKILKDLRGWQARCRMLTQSIFR